MNNQYFLCFSEPVEASEVSEIFLSNPDMIVLEQVFPHLFSVDSAFSYSEIKHYLKDFYTHEHSPRSFVVIKAKGEYEFLLA